jgi:hypothetical protein
VGVEVQYCQAELIAKAKVFQTFKPGQLSFHQGFVLDQPNLVC